MSYREFVAKIKSKFPREYIEFSHDDGKHRAILRDGIKITGNNIAPSVMVTWGSGHRSTIKI